MKHLYFDLQAGELKVKGKTLSEWAQIMGQTPFYLYDSSIIERKISELRQHLPKAVHLHYAVKANPMPEVIRFIQPLVDGFDVASGGELMKALAEKADPSSISFAGPGKRDSELTQALESGVLIHAESIHEIRRIHRLSKSLNKRPRLALRINPDFELKAGGMRMSGGAKAFGIDTEQVPEVCREIKELGLSIEGLHVFSGSQSLKTEIICENQIKCFELLGRIKEHLPEPIKIFNFGGGFGIPYFEGENPVDLPRIGQNLKPLLERFAQDFPKATPVLELGRFLVGECGIYVAKIVDKKISRGETFLVLDGGMNHHLAASGNLGQVIKRAFPMTIGNRSQNSEKETVNVVGPLCTPLDTLATEIDLPQSEIGDLLVVFQSGAYGLSSSPIHFLSHPVPAERLV